MVKPILLEKTDFHLFYYPWWGNTTTDGEYIHWDDNSHVAANDDISSNFYPLQGLYSSNLASLLTTHMEYINRAGVGTIIVSWWGQSSYEDLAVPEILDAAVIAGIKVGFIIEPYTNRSVASTIADIAYLYTTYGSHSAFYKTSKPNKWGTSSAQRGVFYVYDAYALSGWADAVDATRGTANDAILITNNSPIATYSIADTQHFDGFFTYNVKDEHGTNFASIGTALDSDNILWSPSVSGQYNDTRIREGGSVSSLNGQRLNDLFGRAYQSSPSFISIVSFNEWHEGTQIEPCQTKAIAGYTYDNFEGDFGKTGVPAQMAYLDAVAYWVSKNPRRLV